MTTYFIGLVSVLVIPMALVLLGMVISKIAEKFNYLPDLAFGTAVVVVVAYFLFYELPMLVGPLVMQAFK